LEYWNKVYLKNVLGDGIYKMIGHAVQCLKVCFFLNAGCTGSKRGTTTSLQHMEYLDV